MNTIFFRRHSLEMQSQNSQTLKLVPTENTSANNRIVQARVMKSSKLIISAEYCVQ